MSPSHDPWIGRVIAGRYEVLRLLGQGSMALVYLARDRTLGRDVVLKRPHPALLVLEGFPERFRREVQALARQEQLHVVRVLDAGDDDGTPWMALPHLSGGSLADRIAGAPRGLAPAEVAAWLPDVARALDAVHASGWVHRDVKPGNVLFDAQGRVALSDFGIARALGEGEVRLTSTGMPPGSPAYMAPEQAEGLAVSGRTDQYALAVTVYEALCGRLPHVGTDPLALLLAKSQRPARPLHEVRPDLPAGVGAAVERALAHDPAARFPTCAALAEAFVSSLGGRPERRRGLARRRGGLAAAALAVVALAVGWALRAGGREGAPAPAVPSWAQVSAAQVEAARALGVPVAYENPLGMRFVLIPAGTFTMGLPEAQGDLWLEAKATARVTLERAYYLGITEVLNREYRQWPERRGHRSPDADGGAGSDEDDHPAVGVTWHEAVAFLRWLTVVDNLRRYRLPAEAEWEHACRAGTTSRFWWGDDPVLRPPFPANLLDADVATPPQEHAARPGPPDGARLTAGLEGYRPNPWGLWHTAGNAWEWCWDWYAPHVEGAPRPVGGPPTGSARVQRGGTAQHDWKYARSGARTRELPDATGHLSGFRALLELPEPTTR